MDRLLQRADHLSDLDMNVLQLHVSRGRISCRCTSLVELLELLATHQYWCLDFSYCRPSEILGSNTTFKAGARGEESACTYP